MAPLRRTALLALVLVACGAALDGGTATGGELPVDVPVAGTGVTTPTTVRVPPLPTLPPVPSGTGRETVAPVVPEAGSPAGREATVAVPTVGTGVTTPTTAPTAVTLPPMPTVPPLTVPGSTAREPAPPGSTPGGAPAAPKSQVGSPSGRRSPATTRPGVARRPQGVAPASGPAPAAGTADPDGATRQPVDPLGLATRSARDFRFPLGLAVIIGAFLVLQHVVGARDPRLRPDAGRDEDERMGFE